MFYSNLLGLVQTLVLRKFYSPEKYKAQIEAELAAKRAEKKRKKTVSYTDESTGEKVEKSLSETEIARMRLARARAQQEEKFRRQAEEDRQSALKAAEDSVENGASAGEQEK